MATITIDEHYEEYSGTNADTEWPAADGATLDPTGAVTLPTISVNPGDWLLANLGTSASYADPTGTITIQFGASNNGDGTFTYVTGNMSSPSATLPTTTQSSYTGPYAAITPSSTLDLDSDELVDVELLGKISLTPDSHTGEYFVELASGNSTLTGENMAENSVGRLHQHPHNWQTGNIVDGKFISDQDTNAVTRLSLAPNITGAIPNFVADSLTAPVPLLATSTTVVVIHDVAATGTADPVTTNWPVGGPAGAYVFIDFLTTPGTVTWHTAAATADITTDQYMNLVPIGHMGNTKDTNGEYLFHPLYAGTTGVTSTGTNSTPNSGSLTREQDYPHKPHKFEFDGFYLTFDKATTTTYPYITSAAPIGSATANATKYVSNCVIVPETDGTVTASPYITYFDGINNNAAVPVAVTNSLTDPSFIARPDYYVVFNKGTAATITGNVSAENTTNAAAISTTTYQPIAGWSETIPAGNIRCLYYHPDKNHPDLIVLGRMSKTWDNNHYLFIRGWKHGNHINPDHVAANSWVREYDSLSNNANWRHVGFHLELGGANTATTDNTSPAYVVVDESGTQTPVVEIYDTAPDYAIYGTLGTYVIPTSGISSYDSTISYPALVYETSVSTSNYTNQVVEHVANPTSTGATSSAAASYSQAFVAKSRYHLVYNLSGNTITLGSPNVTAESSSATTVPGFSFRSVKYQPKNKYLINLGHWSYKPDKNGFIFLVGAKPGVVATAPAQAKSGATEELDIPKRAYNWKFDNFHFEFNKATTGTTPNNQTTVSLVADASGSPLTISYKDTNTSSTVSSQTSFQVLPKYNIYFNKGQLPYTSTITGTPGTSQALGSTNSSFQTAEHVISSAASTVASSIASMSFGAIAPVDINNVAVNIDDPNMLHTGIVSPGPDRAGYLFLKGWHHAHAPHHHAGTNPNSGTRDRHHPHVSHKGHPTGFITTVSNTNTGVTPYSCTLSWTAGTYHLDSGTDIAISTTVPAGTTGEYASGTTYHAGDFLLLDISRTNSALSSAAVNTDLESATYDNFVVLGQISQSIDDTTGQLYVISHHVHAHQGHGQHHAPSSHHRRHKHYHNVESGHFVNCVFTTSGGTSAPLLQLIPNGTAYFVNDNGSKTAINVTNTVSISPGYVVLFDASQPGETGLNPLIAVPNNDLTSNYEKFIKIGWISDYVDTYTGDYVFHGYHHGSHEYHSQHGHAKSHTRKHKHPHHTEHAHFLNTIFRLSGGTGAPYLNVEAHNTNSVRQYVNDLGAYSAFNASFGGMTIAAGNMILYDTTSTSISTITSTSPFAAVAKGTNIATGVNAGTYANHVKIGWISDDPDPLTGDYIFHGYHHGSHTLHSVHHHAKSHTRKHKHPHNAEHGHFVNTVFQPSGANLLIYSINGGTKYYVNDIGTKSQINATSVVFSPGNIVLFDTTNPSGTNPNPFLVVGASTDLTAVAYNNYIKIGWISDTVDSTTGDYVFHGYHHGSHTLHSAHHHPNSHTRKHKHPQNTEHGHFVNLVIEPYYASGNYYVGFYSPSSSGGLSYYVNDLGTKTSITQGNLLIGPGSIILFDTTNPGASNAFTTAGSGADITGSVWDKYIKVGWVSDVQDYKTGLYIIHGYHNGSHMSHGSHVMPNAVGSNKLSYYATNTPISNFTNTGVTNQTSYVQGPYLANCPWVTMSSDNSIFLTIATSNTGDTGFTTAKQVILYPGNPNNLNNTPYNQESDYAIRSGGSFASVIISSIVIKPGNMADVYYWYIMNTNGFSSQNIIFQFSTNTGVQ